MAGKGKCDNPRLPLGHRHTVLSTLRVTSYHTGGIAFGYLRRTWPSTTTNPTTVPSHPVLETYKHVM